MTYSYSQLNRLEQPHAYMYTPFQGEALLQSYRSSRMAIVRRRSVAEHGSTAPDLMLVTCALPALKKLFDSISLEAGEHFRTVLEYAGIRNSAQDMAEGGGLVELAKGLASLTTAERVTTLDLLHAMIAVELTDVHNASTKVWLDRLVQRFEVTKKLYESYPQGFRKGEGANTSVRLYWLFALALCLYYTRSHEIKYLSTLLKVSDLLCSLPETLLRGHVPEHSLSAVLAAEIVGVQLLAEKKGVTIATK